MIDRRAFLKAGGVAQIDQVRPRSGQAGGVGVLVLVRTPAGTAGGRQEPIPVLEKHAGSLAVVDAVVRQQPLPVQRMRDQGVATGSDIEDVDVAVGRVGRDNVELPTGGHDAQVAGKIQHMPHSDRLGKRESHGRVPVVFHFRSIRQSGASQCQTGKNRPFA